MRTIDGIPFECTRCGDCCRWEGFIFLDPEDIKRLSDYHGIGREEYVKRYTRPHGSSIILKNKSESSDECVYLDKNKCSINNIKPKQCKDYPDKYEPRCPGFRRKGRRSMGKFEDKVKAVNAKLSSVQGYEKNIADNLFKNLKKNIKVANVASKALEEGIDDYFNVDKIKVASLDDLFSFDRAGSNTLIHKSSKDLWNIEKDSSGKVVITRLFSSEGEPIKG